MNLLTEALLLALAKFIYYRKEGTSVVLSSMSPSFLPNLAMLRSYVVKLVLYGTWSSCKKKNQLRTKRQ